MRRFDSQIDAKGIILPQLFPLIFCYRAILPHFDGIGVCEALSYFKHVLSSFIVNYYYAAIELAEIILRVQRISFCKTLSMSKAIWFFIGIVLLIGISEKLLIIFPVASVRDRDIFSSTGIENAALNEGCRIRIYKEEGKLRGHEKYGVGCK